MRPATTTAEAAKAAQPRRSGAQWLGFLGPPVVWLTQFQIKYTLANAPGGSRAHSALIATGAVAIVAVAALAVMSLRQFRRAGSSPLDQTARVVERSRFLALLGLMSSALFLLVIVAQAVAEWFFVPGEK